MLNFVFRDITLDFRSDLKYAKACCALLMHVMMSSSVPLFLLTIYCRGKGSGPFV